MGRLWPESCYLPLRRVFLILRPLKYRRPDKAPYSSHSGQAFYGDLLNNISQK